MTSEEYVLKVARRHPFQQVECLRLDKDELEFAKIRIGMTPLQRQEFDSKTSEIERLVISAEMAAVTPFLTLARLQGTKVRRSGETLEIEGARRVIDALLPLLFED